MTETVLDIKHWGNNLGVRLPAAIARAAHLHADQRVRITVEGERIIITPIHDEALSLERRPTPAVTPCPARKIPRP